MAVQGSAGAVATVLVVAIVGVVGCSSAADEGVGTSEHASVVPGSHGVAASSVDATSAASRSPIPLAKPGQPGLVVGHRGNAAGAPEDTLASEVSGQRLGAQVLEFDLHVTADGVPVVMHDPTVDRTTNGFGSIASMTLAQIERLDAGSSFSPAFAGIRVPTFEQILAFASGTNAIILPELKESLWTEQQVRTVVGLIRRYHMTARTMFQSFHVPVLKMAARVAPDIARAALVNQSMDDPVAYIRQFDGQGLLPNYRVVTRALVSKLHTAGLSIMVWTVDDPAEWEKLTAYGVDGIMSDNPAELSGWIQRYRQSH